MFERFTDRARRVVTLAQETARLHGDNYIGPEHLMLGLVHEGEGLAAQSLAVVGVTKERLQVWVEPRDRMVPPGHLPFTREAKRILELSLRESLAVEAGYIGTEHVLAAWIRWATETARKAFD